MEYGLDLVVVDYLQLMSGGGRFENRVQEVSFISRQLKVLARELNLPVLAAAQLSRAVEQRADKHPVLSDLRESGSIEMDADVVMFLYRPEDGDSSNQVEGSWPSTAMAQPAQSTGIPAVADEVRECGQDEALTDDLLTPALTPDNEHVPIEVFWQ
jgi:replicative DNA helicase